MAIARLGVPPAVSSRAGLCRRPPIPRVPACRGERSENQRRVRGGRRVGGGAAAADAMVRLRKLPQQQRLPLSAALGARLACVWCNSPTEMPVPFSSRPLVYKSSKFLVLQIYTSARMV